jgi:uncharacterized protein (TIGR03084 family)
VTWRALLADLAAEAMVVHAMIADINPEQWDWQTPGGWSIRDQISHLAFFDEAALSALTTPERFRVDADVLRALGPSVPDMIADRYHALGPTELQTWLRTARANLMQGLAASDGDRQVPWYGPDMTARVAATARLVETWAHGQDIADILGVTRVATDRLRHIAHLGASTIGVTRPWRDPMRDATVRVDLAAPGGDRWIWGTDAAADVITGPALDFCLVLTQRRRVADTALRVDGSAASDWLGATWTAAGITGLGCAAGAGHRASQH